LALPEIDDLFRRPTITLGRAVVHVRRSDLASGSLLLAVDQRRKELRFVPRPALNSLLLGLDKNSLSRGPITVFLQMTAMQGSLEVLFFGYTRYDLYTIYRERNDVLAL
jgi:hypothetical protein